MRILLISILGLLTLASCTKQEPMEALIDRVFTVAEQQYMAMDTRLTEKIQSPNQKIPDRKTKCVIKTHINIKQNVIFGAKLKPV